MKAKTNKKAKTYVDGFVLVVKEENLEAYKKVATKAGKIWKKCGALSYKECVGEDLKPDMGKEKIMTFIELAKPKKGESVIFSYIEFKSRKHRDEVNAKVMKAMEKEWKGHEDQIMPFDMKRMAYGGFEAFVSE